MQVGCLVPSPAILSVTFLAVPLVEFPSCYHCLGLARVWILPRIDFRRSSAEFRTQFLGLRGSFPTKQDAAGRQDEGQQKDDSYALHSLFSDAAWPPGNKPTGTSGALAAQTPQARTTPRNASGTRDSGASAQKWARFEMRCRWQAPKKAPARDTGTSPPW